MPMQPRLHYGDSRELCSKRAVYKTEVAIEINVKEKLHELPTSVLAPSKINSYGNIGGDRNKFMERQSMPTGLEHL